jgi:hypothetical protein
VSHPGAKLSSVSTTPALRFAETARRLGASARAAGLAVPAFRCPPRVPDAARTIRRYPGGTVVSVRLRDRRFDEVVADMVEGVLVTNRLDGEPALRFRTTLLEAVREGAGEGAGVAPPPSDAPTDVPPGAPLPSSSEARMAERQTQAA